MRKRFWIASMAFYVCSLFLDCCYFDDPNSGSRTPGLGLLLVGWIVVFDGYYAWLANPILFYIWNCKSKLNESMQVFRLVGSIIALGLSLSFLLHREIPVGEAVSHITGYGPGYYCWVASMLAMVIDIIDEGYHPSRTL